VERGSFGLGRTDTEEYAAVVHQHNNGEYTKREWIAGSTIWVAFDYFQGAPHEGVADEARYPKDVYYYYQSQWSAEPMLRIRSSAHWGSPPLENRDRPGGAAYDVTVDSNCDSVELFLNGRSQGVRTGPGPFVWPQLAYSPGTLKAVGRSGEAVLEHTRTTAGAPYAVVLTADTYELAADGRDVAYLRARLVDSDGRLVGNANGQVEFLVAGDGQLVGPQSQKMLAGVATLASTQSTTKTGEIRVKARIGRLKPGEVVLRTTSEKSSAEYQ
jgi:beta-galactosidase